MPIFNLKVLTNDGSGTYLDIDVEPTVGAVTVTSNGLTNIGQDAPPTVGEGATYADNTLTLPITILGFATTANKTTADYAVGATLTLSAGSQSIYAVPATSRLSVDVSTLAGWANLSAGAHSITIVAKAAGFKDSAPSAAVKVTKAAAMPAKGDIITLDSKQYRVLKTEGTVAEVLAMYSSALDQVFNANNSNVYTNSDLDVYLSQTFYNSLSTTMQSAIVAKTFQQDLWYWNSGTSGGSGNPIYQGTYQVTNDYRLGLGSATFGSSILRKCYVLSVQDVIDYLEVTTGMSITNTTLTSKNLWKMFWNTTISPGLNYYTWLRSARGNFSTSAFYVASEQGYLTTNDTNRTTAVRPAFQIDLSKISWS